MISRYFASCRRLMFLAGSCLALTVVHAQDRLVFKDNHVQDGKILGMSNGSVLITVAGGQMSYNLGLLARVDMAAPASFAAGYAAYQAGEWDKALVALKPLVDQFKGLPAEWASQAAAALADIYLEKNDLPKAVAAYNDYRTYYPATAGNSLRIILGQARIAFAQNNLAAAEKQLQPIRDAALKKPAEATRAEGAIYGQACYLLGQIEERQGSYQAALVDYLRTATLFYEDVTVATRAEKSADALRAAHPGVYAP